MLVAAVFLIGIGIGGGIGLFLPRLTDTAATTAPTGVALAPPAAETQAAPTPSIPAAANRFSLRPPLAEPAPAGLPGVSGSPIRVAAAPRLPGAATLLDNSDTGLLSRGSPTGAGFSPPAILIAAATPETSGTLPAPLSPARPRLTAAVAALSPATPAAASPDIGLRQRGRPAGVEFSVARSFQPRLAVEAGSSVAIPAAVRGPAQLRMASVQPKSPSIAIETVYGQVRPPSTQAELPPPRSLLIFAPPTRPGVAPTTLFSAVYEPGPATSAQIAALETAPAPALASPVRLAAPQLPGELPGAMSAPDAPTASALPQADDLSIQVHAPTSLTSADVEQASGQLSLSGLAIDTVRRVDIPISRSNVRYFRAADREPAARLADSIGARLRDFTSYRPAPPAGTIEVWLAGGTTGSRVASRQPARAAPLTAEDRLRIARQRVLQRLQELTR